MASDVHQGQVWDDGVEYQRYIGRWSAPVAHAFVGWLSLQPASRWLDVGCGSGALTRAILEVGAPGDVLGVDRSEGFVAYVSRMIRDPRAHFGIGDAQALRYPDKWFDAAVSGLVLNFVPDKDRMVHEMARVVNPGGTVGLYVWDYAGEMQMLRAFWDSAVELNAVAAELDEGTRFPVCRPGALEDLFVSAGLHSVEVRAIDVPTRFANFDDYWQPFLGGQGPAPSYVASLKEPQRVALQEALRARLAPGSDGTINLIARAWAVRALVP